MDLPIGTKITTHKNRIQKLVGNPGPLRRKIPLTRTWEPSKHGYPEGTVFTVTGVAKLEDYEISINSVNETETRTLRTQHAYRIRLTPASRELFVLPEDVRLPKTKEETRG